VEIQKGLPHDPRTNSLINNSDFTGLLNLQYHASQAKSELVQLNRKDTSPSKLS